MNLYAVTCLSQNNRPPCSCCWRVNGAKYIVDPEDGVVLGTKLINGHSSDHSARGQWIPDDILINIAHSYIRAIWQIITLLITSTTDSSATWLVQAIQWISIWAELRWKSTFLASKTNSHDSLVAQCWLCNGVGFACSNNQPGSSRGCE